jgi:hypothetical protein
VPRVARAAEEHRGTTKGQVRHSSGHSLDGIRFEIASHAVHVRTSLAQLGTGFSLVSVGLLTGNQDHFRRTCGNQSVKVHGSPLVFAAIVTQLVTQPTAVDSLNAWTTVQNGTRPAQKAWHVKPDPSCAPPTQAKFQRNVRFLKICHIFLVFIQRPRF